MVRNIFLLAGLVCAVAVGPSRSQTPPPASPPPAALPPDPQGDRIIALIISNLQNELDLSDEQMPKVRALEEAQMHEMKTSMRAIMADPALTKDQKRRKMMLQQRAFDLKLRAILTPEQQVKFDSVRTPGAKGSLSNKAVPPPKPANTDH